jgi:hypothetical protein
MSRPRFLLVTAALVSSILGAGAHLSCIAYPVPPQGGLAVGQRLVMGDLLAANSMELGQRDVALQLSAVSFPQGDCGNPVYYDGPQFDPAPRGDGRNTVPFTLTVPCDQNVHLFLQRAVEGASRGAVIAPLTFAAYSGGPITTKIPGLDPRLTGGPCMDTPEGQLIGRRINLGTVTLPMHTPAPAVLGGGNDASINPLKQVDSDADGTDDFDQGAPAGTSAPPPPASATPDAGGATPDAGGTGTGLPASECDSDGDGIPDVLQQ